MACERYVRSIQDAVDGTLGSIRLAELEMHLLQCEACRALHDDLQRIHDAAASLPVVEAPDRAWLQIAGRLRQEGRINEQASQARARSSFRPWLAAAAAAAVITGGALAVILLRPWMGPTPQTAQTQQVPAIAIEVPDERAVETAQNAVAAAQDQFEKAIVELEKVAKANQQALDPGTSATIEKSLGILDQAIAENKAVVKAEPASVAARATLFEVLRQKVNLLQDTITLINEMRKGNNAAAAQLVNKS